MNHIELTVDLAKRRVTNLVNMICYRCCFSFPVKGSIVRSIVMSMTVCLSV